MRVFAHLYVYVSVIRERTKDQHVQKKGGREGEKDRGQRKKMAMSGQQRGKKYFKRQTVCCIFVAYIRQKRQISQLNGQIVYLLNTCR